MAAGGSGAHAVSWSRPLVLPETFDGTGSWDEWVFHFESVSAVNGWNDTEKLKWLRVRLTGRAQKALLRLPEPSQVTYEETLAALKARFDPESRQTRYQAEFQTRRKKTNEGWADSRMTSKLSPTRGTRRCKTRLVNSLQSIASFSS